MRPERAPGAAAAPVATACMTIAPDHRARAHIIGTHDRTMVPSGAVARTTITSSP